MYPLRHATASQEVPLGYFLDTTNGDTAETGVSLANTDIKLHKFGATSLVNKNSGGSTHLGSGIVYVTLDATDSNTPGPLVLFTHPSGSLSVKSEFIVYEEAVYDALFASGAAGYAKTGEQMDIINAPNATAVTAIQNGLATNLVATGIKGTTDNLPDAGALSSIAQADTMEGFFQVSLRSDAAIGTDRSGLINTINRNISSGPGNYSITFDSQESIRDNMGTAGAGLTNITLPDQTMNISGSVGSVTGNINGDVQGNLDGTVAVCTTNADMLTVNDVLTTQMTESYAATGVAPTVAQSLFLIQQSIMEGGISGTTGTVRKIDKTTTAATYTLDDADDPTDRTRAS